MEFSTTLKGAPLKPKLENLLFPIIIINKIAMMSMENCTICELLSQSTESTNFLIKPILGISVDVSNILALQITIAKINTKIFNRFLNNSKDFFCDFK